MYTSRANYKKTEKKFNGPRDYIDEKFNGCNNKYDELKAILNNDTVEKFKLTLKEEISKVYDKLEVNIHQPCPGKVFFKSKLAN